MSEDYFKSRIDEKTKYTIIYYWTEKFVLQLRQ